MAGRETGYQARLAPGKRDFQYRWDLPPRRAHERCNASSPALTRPIGEEIHVSAGLAKPVHCDPALAGSVAVDRLRNTSIISRICHML
jgi:hypothetical protein